MARKVKNLFKRCVKGYINGLCEAYKPCLKAGVNPFL